MDEKRKMIRFDEDTAKEQVTQDEEQKMEARPQVKHVRLIGGVMWQKCGGGRRRLGKRR